MKIVKTTDVMEALHVSRGWLSKQLNTTKKPCPHFKVGRDYRFNMDLVYSWFDDKFSSQSKHSEVNKLNRLR